MFEEFMLLSLILMSIGAKSSNDEAATCVMKRSFRNSGFHREIYTAINISSPYSMNMEDGDLTVLVNEHLPTGIYVDLYQLRAAEQFGGIQIYSKEDIDLEKPEFLSPPHEIFWFSILNRRAQSYSTETVLPIHFRYHQPNDMGLADVELTSPDVYIKEKDGTKHRENAKVFPCNPSGKSPCSWIPLTCHPEDSTTNGHLHMTVPTGRIQHNHMVIGGTLAVSICAMCFLLYSIIVKDVKLLKKIR